MIRVGSAEDHGLALDVIQIDGGTQSRANLNQGVVDDYATAIKDGATFPPIVVFYDGKKHWLADGFHRFHAYQKAGKAKVAADVRQGTRRDAILHSVGANASHGLRRTNDDKRRAVLTLLADEEWAAKPERWIATTANVSHTFVQKIRAAHLATLPDRRAEVEVERGGTVYMQKVLNTRATAAPAPQQGGDEKQEITSETLVPQGEEGGDEPVSTTEEITPRDGYDAIVAAWTAAAAEDRDAFIAYLRVSGALESQAKASEDNGSITGGAGAVAGEASRVGAGRTASATSDDGRDSLERQAPHSPSDGDAFAAVTLNEQLANAAGVEPPPSDETPATLSRQADRAGEATSPASPAAFCPSSDPYDPGPIPAFLDRRQSKVLDHG